MTQNSPLLSIGLPTFNEQSYIRETFASLQQQSYPNIEILVSDNASKDLTASICHQIAKDDPRISVYAYGENRGAVWNFGNVLSLARGQYFMWAGAHDRWHPEFALHCIIALEKSPAIVTAFPAAAFIDESGEFVAEIATAYDTQGLSDFVRPWVTAWLLTTHYAYPVYGVHRTEAIRTAFAAKKCIGADIVTLFHLAFLGSTAYVPGEPQIRMMKRHDYGDWKAYLQKIYGTSDLSYRQAIQDMRNAYLSVIAERIKPGKRRLLHWMLLWLFMPALRSWASMATKNVNV